MFTSSLPPVICSHKKQSGIYSPTLSIILHFSIPMKIQNLVYQPLFAIGTIRPEIKRFFSSSIYCSRKQEGVHRTLLLLSLSIFQLVRKLKYCPRRFVKKQVFYQKFVVVNSTKNQRQNVSVKQLQRLNVT
jgi:hypothetical protein